MIRKAEPHDIPRLTELLLATNAIHSAGRPDLFKEGGIKYDAEALGVLLEDHQRPVFVYVDDDDKVLAYAFCIYQFNKETTSIYARKTLYIDDFCVDEAYRGQHIGKELYNFVCDVAKKRNCHNVTLHVWQCNEIASKFYDAMGMTPLYTTMETVVNEF